MSPKLYFAAAKHYRGRLVEELEHLPHHQHAGDQLDEGAEEEAGKGAQGGFYAVGNGRAVD